MMERSDDVMKKSNCWEFKGCGRGPETPNARICPAATNRRLDGVHGGHNAGRCCWIVAGTYCEGEVQGTFAKKYASCAECYLYKLVKLEESSGFNLAPLLLAKLRGKEPK